LLERRPPGAGLERRDAAGYDRVMRARRATTRLVSVALSLALHVALLLLMLDWSVRQPGLSEPPPLPVRIIEPEARRPAPKPPAPKPAPPPQVVAKAPEIPPPPPPAPEPEPKPENKLPLPEQQIVDQPEAGKNEAPEDTRFLSDRDTKVDEQMVKRGQPKPGDDSAPEKPPAKQAPKPARAAPKPPEPRRRPGSGKPAPPQVAALPGLDRLMPNALRLAEEGYGQAPEEYAPPQDRQARRQQANAGGMWLPSDGPIGTLDYLPDVREGDITLLNTKAEVFAPFVRRVALRVFQNFWISFKRDLSASSMPSIENVEAEAVMSPRGDMIRFTIKQRSARVSLASDRRLQTACNDAFFDRNPPPGARAADGNIHFILRTDVQVGPSPRGWQGYVRFMAGLL
jgi:hypothetical protein